MKVRLYSLYQQGDYEQAYVGTDCYDSTQFDDMHEIADNLCKTIGITKEEFRQVARDLFAGDFSREDNYLVLDEKGMLELRGRIDALLALREDTL